MPKLAASASNRTCHTSQLLPPPVPCSPTYQRHSIEDLLQEDLDGLDTLVLLQLIQPMLVQPLRHLLRTQAIRRAAPELLEDLLGG